MNKFEQVASDAQFAVAILCDEEGRSFGLVDIHSSTDAALRHPSFAGVVGIVDGKPRAALAVLLEDQVLAAVVRAVIARFMMELERRSGLEPLRSMN